MAKKDEKLEQTDIQKLLDLANKSFPNCFTGIGSNPETVLEKIPSGIEVFDRMIGGGLIRGRLHLFSGGFGSGKTYVAQKVIESAQKNNGSCVYIDAEKRFDPEWFKLSGVDIDKVILSRPNFGEEALDLAIFYLKQKVDVIVIDSLAALVPMKEEEDSMEQQSMGLQARMLNKAFRKIIPSNSKTVLIAINQQRQVIGTVYNRGIQKTMPGGEGQYYYASLIVDFRRGEWMKEDDVRVGHEINCVVTKCNFSPPFSQCIIPLRYKTGQVDNIGMIVNLALEEGTKIKKKGGWFHIEGEEQPIQGFEGVSQFYRDHLDKFEILRNFVINKDTF